MRQEAKEASKDVDNMQRITTQLITKQPTMDVLDLLRQQRATTAVVQPAPLQPAANPNYKPLYPELKLPSYDDTCLPQSY